MSTTTSPGPHVYLKLPNLPRLPDNLPYALPPPVKERSFRAPFGIDPWLFNFALQWWVPVLYATAYLLAVVALNAYNRKRGNKPWWIARQSWWQWFVVVHNALLTVYSAATFFAMVRAFLRTWPGFRNDAGAAGIADSLCKMHGPRGLGDATTFNTTINIWEAKNTLIHLGYDGNPDPTDVGRLWNEGLAFWGWVFYVSKFYEVLDTFIIVAKGKRSPTLQTYHHAGAMLCMWAGIRYMSPPIWMFVFVNSFIHALMYTYFTLAALNIKVPVALKRTLTSLQIAQFLWGSTYAAAHLFIQYDIPISTPYQVARTVQRIVSSASSAADQATSTISSVIATPTAFAWGTLAWKLFLRGLGQEGPAELVTNDQGQPFSPVMEEKIVQFKERTETFFETKYRTEWTKVDCIDTSGEAFAIWLNLLYLAPLTLLFIRFFVKAYTNRSKPRTASQGAKQVVQSSKEAEKKTEEKVEETGERLEKELAKADPKNYQEELRKDIQALKNGTLDRGRRVSDHVQDLERRVKSATDQVVEKGKTVISGTGSPRRGSPIKKSGLSTPTSKNGSSIKRQPSKDPVSQPSAGAESEAKQEENLAATQETRPGTEEETKENQPPAPAPVGGVKQEADNKDGVPAAWESDRENKFVVTDAPSRSGPGDETYASVASLEDTDAMGKSGAIVDFAAEKAEELKEEAKDAQKDFKEPFRPVGVPNSGGSAE